MTKDISAQLREAIEQDGRTYYQLAQDSGVDVAALYRHRDKTRDLSLASAAKLCTALGLELRKVR